MMEPRSRSEETKEVDRNWVARLPGLEGLFAAEASSLLRSFSLLSLPFFRTKQTPTSSNTLEVLRSASHHAEPPPCVDDETATKALTTLRTYISDFKSSGAKHDPDESRVDLLYELYLRGFFIAATAGQKTAEGERSDMQQAARQCLIGYIMLESHISETKWKSMVSHITGSIFEVLPGTHLLTPLCQLPRQLTTEVQEHYIQRAGKKQSPATPPNDPVRDNEAYAMHLLDLLNLFGRHVDTYDILPGASPRGEKQTKAKVKAEAEAAKARPKRIALEAAIVACELATSLASADIAEVKARASRGVMTTVPELVPDNGSVTSSEADDDEGDVKPDIREVNKSEDRAQSSRASNEAAIDYPTDVAEWDELAEGTLIRCLETALNLVENRHWSSLTQALNRSEWLDETIPSEKAASLPPKDSDVDSDTDSEDPESDADSDSPGDTGPTPLRAIFRLQDRYEELRLAVWLSLPPDSRGKMSAYMRGIPTMNQVKATKESRMDDEVFKDKIKGRIGEAWDRLGLALLKRFDGRDLERHGLDTEKLDKWEELVSVKSSKRAKKGRKTV